MVKESPNLGLIAGMVVYNEEEALEVWLKAHPFFQHIIVVDQSSTDNTKSIAKSDPRVHYFRTNRFECIAEPDLNLLQKLAGDNILIMMSPDEYLSDNHFKFVEQTVNLAYKNFELRAFYISRKNITDEVDLSPLFRLPNDPEGKDWQLRVTIGVAAQFANIPHVSTKALASWGYIDSDKAWIEHRKTAQSEIESITKRSPNPSVLGKTRDANHIMALNKLLAANK